MEFVIVVSVPTTSFEALCPWENADSELMCTDQEQNHYSAPAEHWSARHLEQNLTCLPFL